MAFVALAIGLARSDIPMVTLAFTCYLLVAAAVLLSALNVRRIAYTHVLPHAVEAGRPFCVETRLSNGRSVLPAFSVSVYDEAIDSHSHTPDFHPCIAPGQRVARTCPSRLNTRGVYEQFHFRLCSDFPFGLVRSERQGVLDASVAVYPRLSCPRNAESILTAGLGTGGTENRVTADVTGDFRGMRDYRHGDHPRLISWPFSARFNALIVRELEQPAPQRVTVLYHAYCPAGRFVRPELSETAMQRLAGLFTFLYRRNVPFEFLSPLRQWQPLAVSSAPAAHDHSLQDLAVLHSRGPRTAAELTALIRRAAQHAFAMVIVSSTPMSHWVQAVPGTQFPIFCMDAGSAGIVPIAGGGAGR